MTDLTSRVAIVTAATSGIGEATARLFASHGAAVVISGRREDKLAALVDELTRGAGRSDRVVAVPGDVTDERIAERLVATAVDRFGGVDIAVNCVGGVGTAGPTHELSVSDWRATVDLNLTSAFLGAKHQLPAMIARGGGSVIFVSTFLGDTFALPHTAAYASSKAALVGLCHTLAVEYGPQRVRANVLVPGGTDTPSNFANAPGATAETKAFVAGIHALKRIALPVEIARAALFLASDASSFVTGSRLYVDGGVSIAG